MAEKKKKTPAQSNRVERGKRAGAGRDASCADARYLILIIDDDEAMRILKRSFLEMTGYRVIEAKDGHANAHD